MAAAIVRPPISEYTRSIGAFYENLKKFNSNNNITAILFYIQSYLFFHNYDLHNIIKIFIDGNSHNKITKLRQVPPVFIFFCLFVCLLFW